MQQVNLYQPIFRKQKKIFSAATMLQISGFFIFVLAGVYLYGQIKLEPVRQEQVRATRQLDSLTKQIENATGNFPQQTASRILESEIARISAELTNKQEVMQALSGESFGNTQGFSTQFEALARGHVTGSWLTGIHITRGGVRLDLSGKSVDPELVPVYMSRLANTNVFDDQNFNIVELIRHEDEPETITFNIGSGG